SGAAAVRRQRILPSRALRQISSSFFVAGSQELRKIRSPQTAGDECPAGRSCFQTGVANSTGGAASDAAMPLAFGPRNWGQSAPARNVRIARSARMVGLYRRTNKQSGFAMNEKI